MSIKPLLASLLAAPLLGGSFNPAFAQEVLPEISVKTKCTDTHVGISDLTTEMPKHIDECLAIRPKKKFVVEVEVDDNEATARTTGDTLPEWEGTCVAGAIEGRWPFWLGRDEQCHATLTIKMPVEADHAGAVTVAAAGTSCSAWTDDLHAYIVEGAVGPARKCFSRYSPTEVSELWLQLVADGDGDAMTIHHGGTVQFGSPLGGCLSMNKLPVGVGSPEDKCRVDIGVRHVPTGAPAEPPMTATPPRSVDETFKEAFAELNQGSPAKAIGMFEVLRTDRWRHMDERSRAVVVVAYVLAHAWSDDDAGAAVAAAKAFTDFPIAFASLAELSSSPVGDVSGAIHVMPVLTGKGETLLYLHNSSAKPIQITGEGSTFDVSYGYTGGPVSVDSVTTSGGPALPSGIVLPPSSGQIVRSVPGSSGLVPDIVAILASAVKARHSGWLHLNMGDGRHTLHSLTLTSPSVVWGETEQKDVVLIAK